MSESHGHKLKQQLCKQRRATIAPLFKRLRQLRGLKQADVARATGLTQSEISRIESGERSIRFVEIDIYARALGMDAGQFVGFLLRTMWEHDDPELLSMLFKPQP